MFENAFLAAVAQNTYQHHIVLNYIIHDMTDLLLYSHTMHILFYNQANWLQLLLADQSLPGGHFSKTWVWISAGLIDGRAHVWVQTGLTPWCALLGVGGRKNDCDLRFSYCKQPWLAFLFGQCSMIIKTNQTFSQSNSRKLICFPLLSGKVEIQRLKV